MWTTTYILSQVSVIIALCFLISSYFLKNRVLILIFSLGNAIFYCIEYLLLGAYTGAVINLIAVARGVWFFVLQNKNKEKDIWSISILSILMIIAGILTFEAWQSLLPMVATIVYTYSIWQKNVEVYRWLSLPTGLCGVVYNIMCHSVIGIISEFALFVFGVVSVIVYYAGQKRTNKEIDEKIYNNETLEV